MPDEFDPDAEREKFAFFTLTHMQLPLQLVIRRELAVQAPLNEAGEVVLEKLILKPGLRGITAAGRSYTAEIDRLLADRKGESNVRDIPNLPSNDGLFKLLELGRPTTRWTTSPTSNTAKSKTAIIHWPACPSPGGADPGGHRLSAHRWGGWP
ncbi:Uncharacterised protein [Chromobacterium violaceum]|uniref:Uncharacterized protein n=1 Tax=Chromobacterium violaceum TaxID=536 RepID=A0A447TE01_CHRVL|nr:Uncharacterised protein [Chromobacterium violaceum]